MSQLSKIFTFDLDGNLFNTPTSFYFEKKQEDGSWKEVEVAPYEYDANPDLYDDERYYRFPDNDSQHAYHNFKDFSIHPGHRGPDGLLIDIKKALVEKLYAPSLVMFKKALIEGQLFAILTARGHEPDNLKRMVELVNEELLSAEEKTEQLFNIKNNFNLQNMSDEEAWETYLNYNGYLPVSNIKWCDRNDIDRHRPDEIKKTIAMDLFLAEIKEKLLTIEQANLFETLSCGFSDDSQKNIESMISYFLKIINEKKYLKNYSVYYTGHQDKYQEIVDHLGEDLEKYVFLNIPEIKKDPEHQILKVSFEQ